MKSIFSALIFATFGLAVNAANASASNAEMTHHGYPIEPVPFTSVKIDDPFWGQRLEAARNVTIPLAFSKCEESGRYDNFIKAANPSESYEVGGFPFDDTDAVSYTHLTLPTILLV